MRKQVKTWLIAATILVLTGCTIFGGMMTALNWDFSKLSNVKYQSNNYAIDEDFKSISINCNTADIQFSATQDENASVICFEEDNAKHTVCIKDGVLSIELVDSRKWYEHIQIFSRTPKITVCLPQGQYEALTIEESTGDIEIAKDLIFETIDISLTTGDVKNFASASNIKIKTTTGDIHAENISTGTLDISVTTGDVTVRSVACDREVKINVSTGSTKLTDLVCNTLISTGSTGDIKMKNVTAGESLSITRSTGDVKFEQCDAGELSVKTSTGDVTGSLLSEKIFITETSTGDVDVPKSGAGGICKITTSTGDINLTI